MDNLYNGVSTILSRMIKQTSLLIVFLVFMIFVAPAINYWVRSKFVNFKENALFTNPKNGGKKLSKNKRFLLR